MDLKLFNITYKWFSSKCNVNSAAWCFTDIVTSQVPVNPGMHWSIALCSVFNRRFGISEWKMYNRKKFKHILHIGKNYSGQMYFYMYLWIQKSHNWQSYDKLILWADHMMDCHYSINYRCFIQSLMKFQVIMSLFWYLFLDFHLWYKLLLYFALSGFVWTTHQLRERSYRSTWTWRIFLPRRSLD